MRDAYLEGHGAEHQPVVKADDFLSAAAGPAMRVSKAATRALSWGSAEIAVVRIAKRRKGRVPDVEVTEIRAVTPDELPALEKELETDPMVDHIEVSQGTMEATLGESFE